jgi:Mg-chelatase subunit ChlD
MDERSLVRRITAFVILLTIISVPSMSMAGGAKESSAERGEYLAGKDIIVPSQEIHIDSYISRIDYHYPKPESGVGVSLYAGHRQISTRGQQEVIQIGIQGRETSFEELPPMNLAFVVDKSTSMSEQDKIDWVKDAFDVFIERLRAKDFVSLVVFDDEARVVFPATQMRSIQDLLKFKDAVHSIMPGGGDNLKAGLTLGYELVQSNFRKQYSNRVLLLSDGTEISGSMVSEGQARPEILQMVEAFNEEHINLSTIGVGVSYDLEFMRDLADKGGGSSRFISGREEMEKTFGSDLDRTFVPTARNLYMTLEFLQDVEILETWGYDNQVDGNTIHYFLDTLHHRDYETVLVHIRIPPKEITGTIQRQNLVRFSLSFSDLKCRRHSQGPYYLKVNFVDLESPVTGFSDGMVLKAGTILHYAQALKKIGEFFYAGKLRPALDLSISIQREMKNARIKLGNNGFEKEIEVLDKYIAVLAQDLALTEAEIEGITLDEELSQSVPAGSTADHIQNMLREITAALESKGGGSIVLCGFMTDVEDQSDLITLLNTMTQGEIAKVPHMRVIEKQKLDAVLEEKRISPTDLLDTTIAIEIGELVTADYLLIGSVAETKNTIVVLGRLINIETANIESVVQVILSK